MKIVERLAVVLGGAACTAALVVTVSGTSGASAATTSTDTLLTMQDDAWPNHDYLTRNAVGTNVDWPMTVVFLGNASINRTKTAVENWSNQFDDNSTQPMHFYMRDTPTQAWTWDQDNGKKTPACPYAGDSSPHYRVYGIGTNERLYNTAWGYYVLASTHRDYSECALSGKRFAQTEQTEDLLVNEVDEDTVVARDRYNFFNAEPLRDEGNHRWENGGFASTIRIP